LTQQSRVVHASVEVMAIRARKGHVLVLQVLPAPVTFAADEALLAGIRNGRKSVVWIVTFRALDDHGPSVELQWRFELPP
jgi:hypothetical protein